jgi:hypothetical protein
MADADRFGDQPGDRRAGRLDRGLGLHVGDLPELGSPVAASDRSIEDGSSVAGDDAFREVAVRRVAAGLCAKSLRRSGEMAL